MIIITNGLLSSKCGCSPRNASFDYRVLNSPLVSGVPFSLFSRTGARIGDVGLIAAKRSGAKA
jgi:hypothetical protein